MICEQVLDFIVCLNKSRGRSRIPGISRSPWQTQSTDTNMVPGVNQKLQLDEFCFVHVDSSHSSCFHHSWPQK